MRPHSDNKREWALGDSPSKARVCFDIETGPEPLGRIKELMPRFKAPSTYKSEEAIKKNLAKQQKDYIEKAPLNAETGRVLAIGYSLCDEDEVYYLGNECENELLTDFWDYFRQLSSATWIGHNSNSFDWPFLVRRSMRHGIMFPSEFYTPIKWSKTLIDTMDIYALGEYQKRISLDRLAKFVGAGEKSGDGADFYAKWINDKEAALKYLEQDVIITKKVWEAIGW